MENKPERKRKRRKLETVDELVTELQSAEETIIDECKKTEKESNDYKRDILIKASEDGTVTQKVEYLKKSSSRAIDKIYKRFIRGKIYKRKREANAFLTDLVVSQFSAMLGGLDAIENPEVLTEELKKNNILKKDIENIVSFVSPYIPLIGLLGGVAIIGKHIYQHKSTVVKDNPSEVNQDNQGIKAD